MPPLTGPALWIVSRRPVPPPPTRRRVVLFIDVSTSPFLGVHVNALPVPGAPGAGKLRVVSVSLNVMSPCGVKLPVIVGQLDEVPCVHAALSRVEHPLVHGSSLPQTKLGDVGVVPGSCVFISRKTVSGLPASSVILNRIRHSAFAGRTALPVPVGSNVWHFMVKVID